MPLRYLEDLCLEMGVGFVARWPFGFQIRQTDRIKYFIKMTAFAPGFE
jgi:hypothetical protein